MELHTLLWSVVSSLSVHTLLAVPLFSRASVVQSSRSIHVQRLNADSMAKTSRYTQTGTLLWKESFKHGS